MARQYWVVSPNVDGKGNKMEEWKKEILRHRAAILGWGPDNWRNGGMGPRFAGNSDARSNIQLGDIVLIARGKRSADMVGFGVVKGQLRAERLPPLDNDVYLRDLDPFKRCERAPKSVPILAVLQHTWAFVQLHPEENPDAKRVCEWMARQLRLTDRQSHGDTIKERNRRRSRTFDYEVRTTRQVKEARRREEQLLDNYEQWLKKQGRHLSRLVYGRMECDAWEEERQNLIEAKGSISRQDIRMAVGQLLDYAFQMRENFGSLNKAILLPQEPPQDNVKWLEPLGIKVIWRSGRSFIDNADGQFI